MGERCLCQQALTLRCIYISMPVCVVKCPGKCPYMNDKQNLIPIKTTIFLPVDILIEPDINELIRKSIYDQLHLTFSAPVRYSIRFFLENEIYHET